MLQIVILLRQAHMVLSASTWRQPGMGYKGEIILETTILTPFGCTFWTDVLRYDLPPAVDQPWSWSGSLPVASWQFPRFREFGKVVCGERLSAQATVPPFTTGESSLTPRTKIIIFLWCKVSTQFRLNTLSSRFSFNGEKHKAFLSRRSVLTDIGLIGNTY